MRRLPDHTPILSDLLREELRTGQIMLDLATTEHGLKEEQACAQALHKARAALGHVKHSLPGLRLSLPQRMEFTAAIRELQARIETFETKLRGELRQRRGQA